MTVKVIKATKQMAGLEPAVGRSAAKLRVAAYCRVSTDSEEQESSYEAQCRHYTDFITENPDWELAGIYADEGISGTSTKRREQFRRMLADCEAGRIDMVITKSISRWARNTVDSLRNIRKLKDLGIPVLFEKEMINTMDNQGELLITIMSSIAQQESQSISQNVRLGIQFLMQQGKGRLNTTQFLGFTKSEDGMTLVIIPEEAALVRRIYREYLEGYSPGMIAARLTADGILTPTGKPTWYQSTVASILENEKYCGDLLMQKYFTIDFLDHRSVRNTGQLPQYFVEDAHEPIIPKKVYYQVQGEMLRRSALKNAPSRIRFGSAAALPGRLICGHCGRVLKRYATPDPQLTDWRCRKRTYEKRSATKEMPGQCPCRNVPEREAKQAILEAFHQLPQVRGELIRRQSAVQDGEIRRIDRLLDDLSEREARLKQRLESLAGMDSDEAGPLHDELERLEEERGALLLERATSANTEVQIRLLLELVDAMGEPRNGETDEGNEPSPACYDYEAFFRRTRYVPDEGILGQDGRVTRFADDMIIRYLDSVTIQDHAYDVRFKCGLTVTVGMREIQDPAGYDNH